MNSKPIGVFDSGIGGLTVVHALTQRLPHENIVYFGDTARVPYGTKSKNTIVKFSLENVEFLLRFGVKAIVIDQLKMPPFHDRQKVMGAVRDYGARLFHGPIEGGLGLGIAFLEVEAQEIREDLVAKRPATRIGLRLKAPLLEGAVTAKITPEQ